MNWWPCRLTSLGPPLLRAMSMRGVGLIEHALVVHACSRAGCHPGRGPAHARQHWPCAAGCRRECVEGDENVEGWIDKVGPASTQTRTELLGALAELDAVCFCHSHCRCGHHHANRTHRRTARGSPPGLRDDDAQSAAPAG